ncbi:hypothetical protein [Colwellia piezophila]|uniref:hypothetical protein n=1 Tax=Colwellia piezophila TaxID=211668 RepID=UPI00037C78C6|nr:hypothetical protein [Colwellia piezophila]
MKYKNVTFDLYRYQLLPVTQEVQPDLYRKILNTEQLKEQKNNLFHEILSNLPDLKNGSNILHQMVVLNKGDWFVFKLGVQKSVEIENENFDKERINNWPHITVIINNRPDNQYIAISKNSKAFSSTSVVVNIISDSLKAHLNNMQLTMQVEVLFDKEEFWNIVHTNRGKITSVRFELISPNMANISKCLKVDLKQINIDTNSHKTCLEFNSADDAALEIIDNNEVIDGLVEYASEGGGDIIFKVNGLKRSVHTQKTNRTIELDELIVENLNIESLETLMGFLKL